MNEAGRDDWSHEKKMEACVLALFVLCQTQSHRAGLYNQSRLKPATEAYFGHFHLIFLKMPPLKHSPLPNPSPFCSPPFWKCCLLSLDKEDSNSTSSPEEQ
jgi:hypothetical protein